MFVSVTLKTFQGVSTWFCTPVRQQYSTGLLGLPTFFLSLSADDNNWVDLMVMLGKCKGQHLLEEEANNLSAGEINRIDEDKSCGDGGIVQIGLSALC